MIKHLVRVLYDIDRIRSDVVAVAARGRAQAAHNTHIDMARHRRDPAVLDGQDPVDGTVKMAEDRHTVVAGAIYNLVPRAALVLLDRLLYDRRDDRDLRKQDVSSANAQSRRKEGP